MFKKIIMALLVVGSACASMAQTSYSLVGSVADKNEEPLPFTNCVLLRESDSSFAYGTTGDMDGRFSISNINEGKYLLRITFMGYEPHWKQLEIDKNIDLKAITLIENSTLLKEVKITANRPLYSANGEKTFYNVSDDPSVQSGNATDALQNAPGVEVDAEGNIKYRGGTEVSIWINDKPSHLKAESLKQYLKSLPAGALQRIEVIAHPSAKYHTKNCVINIVTTAKIMRNELLCLGLNANSKPQIGPWADYVWSNEKIRFNVFVSGDYDNYSGDATSDSRLLSPDSTLSSTSKSIGHSKNHSIGGNFGLDFDYNIDSNTLVNLWLWTTATHDKSNRTRHTERTEFLNSAGRYFHNDTQNNKNTMADASFGVMLEKKLDTLGGMLFVDYTGTLTHSQSEIGIIRTYDSLTILDFDRQRTTLAPSQWHGITTDIALPYSKKGEIDLGLMTSLAPMHKNVNETNQGLTDSLRSYNYANETYELSLYAGVEHHFGHLTLGTSLSMDNAWHNLQYHNADSANVNKHYLTFSPTFHASYTTENMHNFTFSYTHNVTPPADTQLTRFTLFAYDDYSKGNPKLKNEYTDNLELGWTRYFDHLGSIGVSLWYKSIRNQNGTLTDVAYCDQFGRIVTFSQPFNIGTARNGGVELNATLRPLDFMNIRFYANLFDDYYRVQYRPGRWAESEMFCYSLRLNFWTKLWDKLQIFTNATYRSRTQTMLAEVGHYFTIDCGVSSDLFDKRLSMFLNVNDILNTARTSGESVNPYNPSISESTLTSRYVSIGLTWRIGRTEMESQQSHGKKSNSRKKH